jgi:hypothetical protein
MQYREYKTAGQRHIDTCEKLVKHLQNVGNDLRRVQDLTRIRENTIKNIFYLSGYIIECSVYHKFFTCITYPSTNDIYQLNNSNNGGSSITYRDNLGGHFRFTWRPSLTGIPIDKGLKSRPIINFIHSQNSSILAGTVLDSLRSGNNATATGKLLLAQEWDPDTRYQIIFNLTQVDCLEYFKEAKLIFNRLT